MRIAISGTHGVGKSTLITEEFGSTRIVIVEGSVDQRLRKIEEVI